MGYHPRWARRTPEDLKISQAYDVYRAVLNALYILSGSLGYHPRWARRTPDDLKISTTQHAFQQERSTITALTSITQDRFNATEPKSPFSGVHALFVDFCKAFDLVDHALLLEKLATMNISLSFWRWVQSYLSGRALQVKLPGVVSSSGEVIAGVPQGRVISPTLFNVFVNDIDDCCPPGVSISTCKYADDCTQYEVMPTGSDVTCK